MTLKTYITPANNGTFTVTAKLLLDSGKTVTVKRRNLDSQDAARDAVAFFKAKAN